MLRSQNQNFGTLTSRFPSQKPGAMTTLPVLSTVFLRNATQCSHLVFQGWNDTDLFMMKQIPASARMIYMRQIQMIKWKLPTEEWMNMTEQEEIALGIIMIIDNQTTYMIWISKEWKIVQPHYVTGSHLAIKMKHGWCHLKNQFRRYQWSATLKYGLWKNNIPSFAFYRFFLAYESTSWSLKTL